MTNAAADKSAARVGVVAIGRNEGERLRRCLESLVGQAPHIVYVDSGSTDDSVDTAQKLGVDVVALDMSVPFTAARARNAGFERLMELDAQLEFVQFVDGDCEVVAGWIAKAVATMDERSDVTVVCGRRQERHRDATFYNRLTDMMDWDMPIGEVNLCGGDALMRVAEFKAVGGFDPTLIAGEEPELCVRLRRAGGKILRIAADMTWHDAGMTHFSQWWKRCVRAGHAYVEGAYRQGRSPQRHFVRQTRSILVWGGLYPLTVVLLAIFVHPAVLLALLFYGVQWWRLLRQQRGRTPADARLYATFVLISKFAQFWGALKFFGNLLRGKRTRLIEYKHPPAARGSTP